MVIQPINAKRTLESVEEARSQVGRLRRTVSMLQSKCTGKNSSLCGVIGNRTSGRPEMWDVLADQRELLQKKEKELALLERKVEKLIDTLPHYRWRMVLRCHYLDGMELSQVAQALTESTGREFSPYQIYRFHRAALNAAEKLWPVS